jgi:hypothetical protein
MGRKRIEPNEKKTVLTISLKKENVEYLKKNTSNVSRLIEELVENWVIKQKN